MAGPDAGPQDPAAGGRETVTRAVTRGVCRALAERNLACLTEFTLGNGRRADVMALAADGTVTIVEIKSSLADFQADAKWTGYLDYCDRFYFAVDAGFPRDALPAGCGLLVADAYGAEELRPAPEARLHASRRRALVLRFARHAATRVAALIDPRI